MFWFNLIRNTISGGWQAAPVRYEALTQNQGLENRQTAGTEA